ncbi:MAG: YicC family protein [Candidatus Eisenbacteria bacterium]|nr:YicC family protein [Candidatus Eisenbacteria bacterium]
MVHSMTGFGRGECQGGDYRVTIEIRAVNHRFLEVTTRLPRRLATLENRVREKLQGRISRGKVHASVNLDGDAGRTAALRLNEELAQRYLEILREIKARFGLQGEIDLSSFVTLPDVLEREEDELSEQAGWTLIEEPLDQALAEFERQRAREGEAMTRDLRARLAAVGEAVRRIEARQPEVSARVRERLSERLAQVSQDIEYNRYRLEAELTLFADRSDVTEECTRLRSHCDQFEHALAGADPAGRRLNFLLQEMNREANTIGAKCQDLDLSREAIFLKEEIEKIREQVQNIE